MFPIIEHISDILPHINKNSQFVVLDKGQYTVIDYVFQSHDTFKTMIERECRGIKFDKDGKIIARPFHKFFNINEREETKLHNLDFTKSYKIMSKHDGSMIHPVVLNDKLYLMTRKGYTDTARQAMHEALTNDLQDYMRICIENGKTPIYEYVSPNNRIVLSYEKPELILIGLRDIVTGEYKCFDLKEGHSFDDNIDNFVSHTKNKKGIEGYVIQFNNGNMVKLKTDEYVSLHRAVSDIDSEKKLLRLILLNQTDDLYPLLSDERKDLVLKYENKILKSVQTYADMISTACEKMKDLSQKEFALWVQENVDTRLQAIYFNIRKGDIPHKAVILSFFNIFKTKTLIEKNRDLLMGAKYNNVLPQE